MANKKGSTPIGIEPALVRLHPDECHTKTRWRVEALPPSSEHAHSVCGLIGVEHGDRVYRRMPYTNTCLCSCLFWPVMLACD